MNHPCRPNIGLRLGPGIPLLAAAAFVLAACAATPTSPPGSADARSKLTRLQADPNLGTSAPAAIEEAEAAVVLAEAPLPEGDPRGARRVYMADRQVAIAVAEASTRFAEDQRARLDAGTHEADHANIGANIALGHTEVQRLTSENAASDSAELADELRRQIASLQAEVTERGVIVTPGGVLFASGRADIQGAGHDTLDKLAAFLRRYPANSVAIEGHTDDVGSAGSNQRLSERRADAVKSFLVQAGIGADRLTASGLGESRPRVDNTSADNRRQNRRVELVIGNPPATATAAPRAVSMTFRRGPCEAPTTAGNGNTE